MRKKLTLTLAKIAISAGLLYWILHDLDLASVWQVLVAADASLLAIAFAMFFLGYLMTAMRWRMLLRAQGIQAQLGFLIRSFMVGIFFNNLLPSTIGGDAVRMYDSWRLGNTRSGAASVILVDRLMGLLALAVYSLATVLFSNELVRSVSGLPLIVLCAAAALAGLAWVVFLAPGAFYTAVESLVRSRSEKLGQVTAKITSALAFFNGQRSLLLRAFGLSLLLQLNVIIHFIVVSRALGIDIPPVAMFTIIPLSIFLMMLPITINGIGLRESVFVFFFSAYGIASVEAIAFAWIALGFVIFQGILGGIIFAVRNEAAK